MSESLAFLRATRFWAMVLAALSVYGQAKGWIGQPEMLLIATITAGFTVVRTIDRATERTILASAVEAGQVPVAAILDIPPLASDALTQTPKAP